MRNSSCALGEDITNATHWGGGGGQLKNKKKKRKNNILNSKLKYTEKNILR